MNNTFKEFLGELDRSDLEWGQEIAARRQQQKDNDAESAGAESFRKSMQPEDLGLPERGSVITTPNAMLNVQSLKGHMIQVLNLQTKKSSWIDSNKVEFVETGETPLGKKKYTVKGR